jgi:Zn-finger nucleic acid-binding protein
MIPVCPKCDVQLLILRLGEVEVDFCHECSGLWLDAGELEMLTRHSRVDEPLAKALQQRGVASREKHLCPRCDRPLREIVITAPNVQALTLDRCPRGHGLWFDADELRHLLTMFPNNAATQGATRHLNEIFAFNAQRKERQPL